MKSTHRRHIELTAKLEVLIENPTVVFEQSAQATMLACEKILRKDWDSEEEDSAWAHL